MGAARQDSASIHGLLFLLACVLLAPAAARADQVRRLAGAAAVEAWVRLKGDASGAVSYEWVTGTAFGVPVDAPAVALFRMESVTVRRFRRIGAASYIEHNYACRLYRDASTGEFIDRFVNPLTGREVALATRCTPSPAIRYTPEKIELLSEARFESSALGVPMQLEVVDLGDLAVVRRHVRSQFVSPTSGELRRELSVDSFTLSRRLLAARRRASWNAAYHWESVGGWMTDLGMGERPGRMLWSIFGRKAASVRELPEDFRRALLQRIPDALTRPLP